MPVRYVSQWLPTSSGIASGFNSTDYMALVPYQPSYDAKDAKAAAERAASSSKQLLRALHELRRVDSILEGCYVFWANMDGTVQKLGQMKEHAERLVNFAGSTPKLRQRFEQRMKEYGDFWTDLERLCRQYSSDHHASQPGKCPLPLMCVIPTRVPMLGRALEMLPDLQAELSGDFRLETELLLGRLRANARSNCSFALPVLMQRFMGKKGGSCPGDDELQEGEGLLEAQRYQEALQHFASAVAQQPQKQLPWFNQGLAAAELWEAQGCCDGSLFETAASSFRTVLQLDTSGRAELRYLAALAAGRLLARQAEAEDSGPATLPEALQHFAEAQRLVEQWGHPDLGSAALADWAKAVALQMRRQIAAISLPNSGINWDSLLGTLSALCEDAAEKFEKSRSSPAASSPAERKKFLPGMATMENQKYSFECYSPRAAYWSYDGIPFTSFYVVVLAAVLARQSFVADHLLLLLVPAALHVLLFLATQWSVQVRCLVRFKQEDIQRASHVKVVPTSNAKQNSKILLVPVHRHDGQVSISYLKKRFIYSEEHGTFQRLQFDIQSPLSKYLASTGLAAPEIAEQRRTFGENVYDIPLPTFGELFQEHAVAPFFVFQLFCVLLWLMDDYWYYSLLTLFLLVVLEAQLVHRRRSDLSELRAMRIPPRPTHVLRKGKWQVEQSNELLPGDIIGIQRSPDASFPCDALLLQGSVLVNEAMLTGESVPQMKVHASSSEEALDMAGRHRQHVVSAGTNIMMHQSSGARGFPKVPVVGSSPVAIGYVLRTGFDTTQGKLCRTILFSADRVTVSSKDAYHFILILLFFALVACAYVLYDGLIVAPTRETPRSTFKLLLAVSHIITAVVPPEFPIMLSLAVNLSLVELVKKRIFCTEPFRVPLAGKIQTCCFDKTGTLTSDSMEVGGVHGLEYAPPPFTPADEGERERSSRALEQKLPFLSTAVMAACNGLTLVEETVVGDPLEKAAQQAVQWRMSGADQATSKLGRGPDRLHILRRYPFASELQRMAVLVRHRGPGLGFCEEGRGAVSDRVLALVKGSCDALKPRLAQAPQNLDELQDQLTKSGFRVLCLAAKEMAGEVAKFDAEALEREAVESELQFCGLLVLRNSVKPNTSSTIRQLRKSYHRVLMITGDHPQTACQVAMNVCMANGRFLVLEGSGDLEWRYQDHEQHQQIPFKTAELLDLARSHTLCVPGSALAKLRQEEVEEVVGAVTVFARVSPQQKEQVILALNQRAHTVMVNEAVRFRWAMLRGAAVRAAHKTHREKREDEDEEQDLDSMILHVEHLLEFVSFTSKALSHVTQGLEWLRRGLLAWQSAMRLALVLGHLAAPEWRFEALRGDVLAAGCHLLGQGVPKVEEALQQGSLPPQWGQLLGTAGVIVPAGPRSGSHAAGVESSDVASATEANEEQLAAAAEEAYSKAVLLGGGSGPLLQLGELHLESARRGRPMALASAAHAFQAAARAEGEDRATAWYNLACVAGLAGQPIAAAKALRTCLGILEPACHQSWIKEALSDT
ncbi:unnamed protein product, partial [Effrenium voratum]